MMRPPPEFGRPFGKSGDDGQRVKAKLHDYSLTEFHEENEEIESVLGE